MPYDTMMVRLLIKVKRPRCLESVCNEWMKNSQDEPR